MSIEKLSDSSKIYVERNPYVQILSNIVEYIKDNDAYRLYSYLASKSRDWQVAKKWTAQQCGVGQTKAKKCWSYLERCGLIEYVIHKNEKGKILKYDMRVLNGSRFNRYISFLKKYQAKNCQKPIGIESEPMDETQWSRNPPTGKPTPLDFSPQLNKDSELNKDIKPNKEKSFYKDQKQYNSKRHDFADSMDQMANEQRHIAEHEQTKRAPMPDFLRELCKKIKISA